MCDFKPGDEVVCVMAAPCRCGCGDFCPLTEGGKYTVFSVEPYNESEATVQVVEIGHYETDAHLGFSSRQFRKVERKTDKLSLTQWLSQPSGDTDHLDKPLPAKKRERAQ